MAGLQADCQGALTISCKGIPHGVQCNILLPLVGRQEANRAGGCQPLGFQVTCQVARTNRLGHQDTRTPEHQDTMIPGCRDTNIIGNATPRTNPPPPSPPTVCKYWWIVAHQHHNWRAKLSFKSSTFSADKLAMDCAKWKARKHRGDAPTCFALTLPLVFISITISISTLPYTSRIRPGCQVNRK